MFFAASKILWFFATPSNLILALTLGGPLLTLWPRTRRLGLSVAWAGAILLLIAGLSPLSSWLLLPLEERFPQYQNDGKPISGAIVLGGALEPRATVLRGQVVVNEAAERLIAVSDLLRRFPNARIVFTGGTGALMSGEPSEAEQLSRYASTFGIDPTRVTFESASRTTHENAVYTALAVKPHEGELWLLVTSAWHMPRSIGAFRKAGFKVMAYPVDFRLAASTDAWRPFALVSDGLQHLDVAFKEWLGLVAYRVSGRTTELFPAP